MTTATESELYSALMDSTLGYIQHQDQVIRLHTDDQSHAHAIWSIVNLTKKIIASTMVLFSVKSDEKKQLGHINSTKLGESVLSGLKNKASEITKYYPFHEFNPYVGLFFKHSHTRHLYGYPFKFTDEIVQITKIVDSLNGFISDIRKDANSKIFQTTMKNFRRSSEKNFSSLNNYIAGLFKQHARMIVLRIDFGYKKEDVYQQEFSCSMPYEQVKQDREALLSYLRKKIPLPSGSFLGYAWKLEFGLGKSYHHHVMIFLDGDKVREDVTIAKMIGDHWNTSIAKDRGLYFNCNAFKGGYKQCGIGMLHFSNTLALEGLRKAVLYMTKTDFFIKMVAPLNDRCFGKSELPKRAPVKMGRPRTKAVVQVTSVPALQD